MNRFLKTTTAGAFLLIAVVGCGRKPAPESAAHPAATAAEIAVRVIQPGTSAPAPDLTLPGRVAAAEEITVTARIPARLTALQAREGDSFRRGQRLVEFDAPETRQQLASARAGLKAARMRQEVAERQLGRVDSLFARGIVARAQLDAAQSEMESARAGLAQAESTVGTLEEGLAIPAPFDGVVVRRYVDLGARLNPGEPILDLRSRAANEVEVSIPESALYALESGRISLQMPDGRRTDAVLSRLEGMTDYRTRTRVARFKPVAGEGEFVLEPGAFVRVSLAQLTGAGAADPNAGRLYLPAASIVARGALRGAYVVENGVARLRWLRVGREEAGQVEILAGLDAGTSVVVDPKDLFDGRAVRTAS